MQVTVFLNVPNNKILHIRISTQTKREKHDNRLPSLLSRLGPADNSSEWHQASSATDKQRQAAASSGAHPHTKFDWIVVREPKGFYEAKLRTYFARQPLSPFLSNLFTKGEVNDRKLVKEFGPRYRITIGNWVLSPHPIDTFGLNWSGDMRFSMNAWWVHPKLQLCSELWPDRSVDDDEDSGCDEAKRSRQSPVLGKSTLERKSGAGGKMKLETTGVKAEAGEVEGRAETGGEKAHARRQKLGESLSKPSAAFGRYLHCARDLTRDDLPELRKVISKGVKMMLFLIRKGFASRGALPASLEEKDIKVFVNYPSAPWLSTLHINFTYGLPSPYPKKVGREHHLDVVTSSILKSGKWGPTEYMLKSYWGMAKDPEALASCVVKPFDSNR
mmetsp:Transcript_13410/g.26288  ORF Transcript_13410/g.26288 Transcript_13410/m.26288 type:complete len:387 (+) Transcript_13410:163-1323(+)